MSSENTTFLNIELREIDSVKPYERNPRINDKAVDAVAASLKEFGFRQSAARSARRREAERRNAEIASLDSGG